MYSDIKDLNQTNIIKHTIELLDKALIAQGCYLIDQRDRIWKDLGIISKDELRLITRLVPL